MKTHERFVCNIALVFAILCILGVHTSFAQCTASLFAGGTGTETDPYQISTPEQLQNLNKCLGSSYQNNYYVLNNDIDLSLYLSETGNNDGKGWQPIGSSSSSSFYGKFNGDGHKVSGLWINRPAQNVGLFGYTGAEIRNIGVEIDDGNGGVRGGYINVGGLVGWNDRGTIVNSYATGSVTGSEVNFVGGLVGYNSGTISNSYATGTAGSDKYGSVVGGLVGQNKGTISNSYATGSVQGNYVGGLVGSNERGTISNSYATGSVTVVSTNDNSVVGGLVGSNEHGTISNSYATGSVTDMSSVTEPAQKKSIVS